MKKLNIPSYSVLLPKENRIRAIQELYWGLNLTDEERAAVESGINKSLVDKLSATPVPQLLERKMQFQTIMESTEQLQCSEGYLYIFNLPVNTLNIALPEHEGNFLGSVIINMCTGNSPAITFYGPGVIRTFSKGFEIKANSAYEINCMYYGGGWGITAVEIVVPFFAKLYLNNGEVVELQGSGELTSAMVSPYSSSVVSAEIGKLCTTIGERAFSDCSGLTSITIPDSVTSIGDSAFFNCSGLTSVTIGNGVTSIGGYVFCDCSGLTSITIPDSVTSIGSSAFDGCSGLTSITIPDSVTTIGNRAFNWCAGLTNVIIGSGVTSIGEYAFAGCSDLTSVTIPNSVTSIGDNAFSECTGLTSITSLATKAPTIQSNTFQGVQTYGTLTVPSDNTGYDVWMGYLGNGWTKVEQ